MWGNCTQRVSVRNERVNTTVDNLSRPAAFSSLLTAKRKYCVTCLPYRAGDDYSTILFVYRYIINFREIHFHGENVTINLIEYTKSLKINLLQILYLQ
ncbi:unnamed protein product [Acanthoscelides obtectus]|uniref:Uncharacterized protein n=1 Tax=Acanthoscelides obtectus TaxID=200917 RepID=A0A9P0PAL6_ACAOB|nr:unnamed protein product [Acanthoscelides obtectus]CAK1653684.1 hypothetical protein AOBTE_LOCUS18326 [Acanthoscelides obtectus]